MFITLCIDLKLPTSSVSCSLETSPKVYVLYLFISQSKCRAHCMQSTKVNHQYEPVMPNKITGAFFPYTFQSFPSCLREYELPS